MYLPLITGEIWTIDGQFSPPRLFKALNGILLATDVLVVGTYNPCDEVYEWLRRNDQRSRFLNPPFRDSFEFNRHRYPRAGAFLLTAQADVFDSLRHFLTLERGSLDKRLFFDHLVAYRPGVPTIPLISFHDAFLGGKLQVSALYSEAEVRQFVLELDANASLISNPEFGPFETEEGVET